MFLSYIKLPDGSMYDRFWTADLMAAEAHFAHLCEQRWDGSAVAILQSPAPHAIPDRRYRLDRDLRDDLRLCSETIVGDVPSAYAERIRTMKDFGRALFLRLLALVGFPIVFVLSTGALMSNGNRDVGVSLALAFLISAVLAVIFFREASKMRDDYSCGKCFNEVGSKRVKMCPSCGATLTDSTNWVPR